MLKNVLPWDATLYEELKEDNEKELVAIQKEEEEAEGNAGETEVQAARGKRAEFWARIGDKVGEIDLSLVDIPNAVTSVGQSNHCLRDCFRENWSFRDQD